MVVYALYEFEAICTIEVGNWTEAGSEKLPTVRVLYTVTVLTRLFHAQFKVVLCYIVDS